MKLLGLRDLVSIHLCTCVTMPSWQTAIVNISYSSISLCIYFVTFLLSFLSYKGITEKLFFLLSDHSLKIYYKLEPHTVQIDPRLRSPLLYNTKSTTQCTTPTPWLKEDGKLCCLTIIFIAVVNIGGNFVPKSGCDKSRRHRGQVPPCSGSPH